MPMREGYAQDIYLVTSGELMSLYAANNICKAIKRLSSRTKSTCRLAGVICNAKNQPREEELVSDFARLVNSSLVQYIPRDRVVQLAELNRKTVLEYEPDSAQAEQYRSLATRIMKNTRFTIPTPLEIDDLESLALEYI
jgi:nitrogenase iron protein NifH